MPKSATAVLSGWCREVIRAHPEEPVNIPMLADLALEEFQNDVEFTTAFFEERFRAMVYTVLAQEVGRTRRVRTDQVAERLEAATRLRVRSRWEHWLEWNGTTHRRLMDMTKADLNSAISLRLGRAESEYVIARTFRELAGALRGGQQVKDAWTAEEIEAIFQRERGEDESAA